MLRSRWKKIKFLEIFITKKNIQIDIEDNSDCNSQLIYLEKINIIIHAGNLVISIIDLNKYKIIKTIRENNNINSICLFNNNIFLTGDDIGNLKQWKYYNENNNLEMIFNKNKIHDDYINSIILDKEKGRIITGFSDSLIKIFE